MGLTFLGLGEGNLKSVRGKTECSLAIKGFLARKGREAHTTLHKVVGQQVELTNQISRSE